MTTISEIQKAVIPIARAYGVKRLYLFGSYAKGTADRESDIDLLVEKGKPMSLSKLSGMRQTVQETLNLSVDLVTTAGMEEDMELQFPPSSSRLKPLCITLQSEMM